MGKWLWVVLVFIVFCFSTVFLLYQYGGLKYYLKAVAYVRANSFAEPAFYGNASKGIYNGIFAGTWMNRVWLWGIGGLRYFPVVDGSTSYKILRGCSGEIPADVVDIPVGRIQPEFYQNLSEWGTKLKVGDYVSVTLDTNTPPGVDNVMGMDIWMFEMTGWGAQCAH